MILNQFFELLRSGLWGKLANVSLFEGNDTDWNAIYQLAQQQTVIALVFDGINTLPANLRPPRALYMQWCAQVARIEEANEHLNSVAVELFSIYKGTGIQAVLLKGQGIATNYLNLNHRQCGDIDVYVGKEQYKATNKLMKEIGGTPEHEDSIKHTGFDYKGVSIEVHRIVGVLHSPKGNHALAGFIKKWLPERAVPADINGNEILVPAPTFNAVYIFTHAFHHFLNSGFGLRQLCDWTRLIDVKSKDIDPSEVSRQLAGMRLLKAAGAFAYIAVTYLGLSQDKVPFPMENVQEDGEELLADILMTGNFGQHDTRVKRRPKGYWAGKWHTFIRATKRCNELRRYAPREASWYPFSLIRGTIVIQWNKLMKKINR